MQLNTIVYHMEYVAPVHNLRNMPKFLKIKKLCAIYVCESTPKRGGMSGDLTKWVIKPKDTGWIMNL